MTFFAGHVVRKYCIGPPIIMSIGGPGAGNNPLSEEAGIIDSLLGLYFNARC